MKKVMMKGNELLEIDCKSCCMSHPFIVQSHVCFVRRSHVLNNGVYSISCDVYDFDNYDELIIFFDSQIEYYSSRGYK